jgi:NitT/TauT family transport system ATP-binding protein
MIEVEAIRFCYSENETVIFQDFSWSLIDQTTCSILGPSGCGKSTLLYLLAGLLVPEKGVIRINGEEINRPRPESGLILQEYGLLPWATVWENVELGLKIRGFYGPDGTHAPSRMIPPDRWKETIANWLERLGLADQAKKFPSQLSGGQRQRTAIARTLVLQPDVLLMDEPFSSLDAPTRESLQEVIVALCADQGITLVLVTHSIEEAAFVGKTILLLDQPPNTKTKIIQNSGAGVPGYRETTHYQELCLQLRGSMGMR